MTRPPRALSTLIACIYDCAGGQDDWAPVLAEPAVLMRADRSLLFSFAPRPELERILVGHEVPPQALAAYAGYYHERDVLFANGHAAMRAGRGAGVTRRGHINPYPMPLVGGVRPCAPDPCGPPGSAKGA